MSLLSKIFTAIRGGAREAGEAIVDKNSVRIFEQEIKDAEEQLEKAKHDLADLMAKEMQASRSCSDLAKEIKKHEGYAQKALSQNNEDLALEVAQKIADLEANLEVDTKSKNDFGAHAKRLKDMIKKSADALKDMQRQLTMVKATDSVQKTTASITENYASGSSDLLKAKESLDRVKEKQAHLQDKMEAGELLANEFNEKGLEERLQSAGIVKSESKAQDILTKLKAKK